MDRSLHSADSAVGGCFQILENLSTPYSLTAHTSGLLFLWCLLLPLTTFPADDWTGIPGSIVISLLLLGIDEIANQLENPFPHLPLAAMVKFFAEDAGE